MTDQADPGEAVCSFISGGAVAVAVVAVIGLAVPARADFLTSGRPAGGGRHKALNGGADPAGPGRMSGNGHFLTRLEAAPVAPSTAAAYAGALARFHRWRRDQAAGGADPGEAPDDLIAAYVAHLARRATTATTSRIAVSALRLEARVRGAPDPAGPKTEAALRRHARAAAGRGRGQAAPMEITHLHAVIRTARRPRGRETPAQAAARGTRDVAIVGLAFWTAARISEIAHVRAADVTPAVSPAGAVRVRIPRSKSNQFGARVDTRLVRGAAAAALLALARRAAAPDDHLFPTSPRQIARIIETAGREADDDGRRPRLTGHSGRVGFAVESVRRGASAAAVAVAGGWSKLESVLRYVRPLAAEDGVVAQYYGPADDGEPAPQPDVDVDAQARVLPFSRAPK